MRVSDVLDIIDGWDSDIGDDADENDSDGDEDYQPRQDQSSDDSDSADDSNQSFVPVAVQYRRPPPDATSSQSTSTNSSASKPQSSTSRGKAKVPKPTLTGRSVPSSLQIAHFWALLNTLISKMFRPWNFSPNSSQMRWLEWSWNRLICIPVKSPERLSM
ncbi:hypothetical protein RRG08_003355 [Elysia crispata]|uniref:Uncharacterized protein n=1 Tax=Elysia crispata TaxID=231223 RepID=A0AAE1CWA7_9GAST|nr:hypothetical protein RRG08_003355 [Elysia crispata]